MFPILNGSVGMSFIGGMITLSVYMAAARLILIFDIVKLKRDFELNNTEAHNEIKKKKIDNITKKIK